MLDRIRESRDDAAEDKLAGRDWGSLLPNQLPPCKADSGVFMNPNPWVREFVHPYVGSAKCKETHGDMQPRLLNFVFNLDRTSRWTSVETQLLAA